MVEFPFRSQTIGVLVEAIPAAYSKAQIRTLLLKSGADEWEPERSENKEHLLQLVFKGMRGDETEAAARAAQELVRLVMEKMAPLSAIRVPWHTESNALRDALAADGWEYHAESSRLMPITPGISAPKELNGLEGELERRGWSTATLHFRQGAAGFGAGERESANSQLRSFLEDFLPRVAEQVGGRQTSNAAAAIQALDHGFLLAGERDFLKALWSLCNKRGSHPGASSRAEATVRLMTVTAEARFLLDRLDD